MLLKYSIAIAVLLGAVALVVNWPGALSPPKATAALAERLLQTLERGDYAAFIAEADKKVAKMRSENFQMLADRHAARLRQGYQLQPLDERWRGEVHVCRWTVTFRDGGPNAIVTLGLRDGRVATFAMY